MVKVFTLLLPAIVAGTWVAHEEVDQTGLLQTSKHRSGVVRAHHRVRGCSGSDCSENWEASWQQHDCTYKDVFNLKLVCPKSYMVKLNEAYQKQTTCFSNSIAELRSAVDDEKAAIIAAEANAADSEQKTADAKACTDRATKALAELDANMTAAEAEFTTDSEELEADISDLATQLNKVRSVALKVMGLMGTDECKVAGTALLQTNSQWGFLADIVSAVEEAVGAVGDFIEEKIVEPLGAELCKEGGLVNDADHVCYQSIEAKRISYHSSLKAMSDAKDKLTTDLAQERELLLAAEKKEEAERVKELAAIAENESIHADLEKLEFDFAEMQKRHTEELELLNNNMLKLQDALKKWVDALGQDLITAMINAAD